MTDDDVAKLLCDAYDRAKSVAWVDGSDDRPETRHGPRVYERWLSVVRIARDRFEPSQREQTAATILAALIPVMNERPVELTPEVGAALAVRWADALRAELAKVNP